MIHSVGDKTSWEGVNVAVGTSQRKRCVECVLQQLIGCSAARTSHGRAMFSTREPFESLSEVIWR